MRNPFRTLENIKCYSGRYENVNVSKQVHQLLELFFPYVLNILLLIVGLSFLVGCTSRESIPVISEDGTKIFASKDESPLEVKVKLYRKQDSKTGELKGEGSVFSIIDEANLRSQIEISGLSEERSKLEMFHIDWVAPNGKSIYQKRIDISKDDTIRSFTSSISVSSDLREPGDYFFRVYYFRELILEKPFTLLPKFQLMTEAGESITASVVLSHRMNKETGRLKNPDTVFELKPRRVLKALVDLDNRHVYALRELLFRCEWTDSLGQTFYQKRFDLMPSDSANSFLSSISIAPDKRTVGNFSFKVFLFDELIAEQDFRLKEKVIPTLSASEKIKASIRLYSKKEKGSGKLLGEGSRFKLGEKAKVRTLIKLDIPSKVKRSKTKLQLKWIDPKGKGFYTKTVELKDSKKQTVKSAIKINPAKRVPGIYRLQLIQNEVVVAEKEFELVEK